MTRKDLNEILAKHKLWLQGKDGGERANLERADLECADLKRAHLNGADLEDADLECANFEGADLEGAYLKGAFLKGAKLEGANLKRAYLECADLNGAKLNGANLKGADIDYSAWPLWCGSLKAHVDDRIAVQLLYHTLSVVQHSPYVSEEIKRTLLTPDVVKVANRFHRVNECGELKAYDNVEVSE